MSVHDVTTGACDGGTMWNLFFVYELYLLGGFCWLSGKVGSSCCFNWKICLSVW